MATKATGDEVKDGGAADHLRRKTDDILEACKWRNIEALGSLASTRGGFLTDDLRRKACKWPSRRLATPLISLLTRHFWGRAHTARACG